MRNGSTLPANSATDSATVTPLVRMASLCFSSVSGVLLLEEVDHPFDVLLPGHAAGPRGRVHPLPHCLG